MKTKRRVSLGGVQLDEIDERIIIQGVEPQAGKETITTVSLWGTDGGRVTGRHRDYLDINVKFSIDIKKSRFTERSAVFEKVMAWAAAGGTLKYNGKPGRKLRVIATQLPAEGDAEAWTNQYTIRFTAYGIPYWQDESAKKMNISGIRSGTNDFNVPGNTTTVMEMQFTNNGGATANSITIQAGSRKISLSNLGLAAGETLKIDHNDNGSRSLLRIRIENTAGSHRSALDKRTAGSDDDLYVEPGIIAVQFTSDRTGTLQLSCNGRYV